MAPSAAFALTIPGGNLGNQRWTLADSPVEIQGDATVQSGATLQIDGEFVAYIETPLTEVDYKKFDFSKNAVSKNCLKIVSRSCLKIC